MDLKVIRECPICYEVVHSLLPVLILDHQLIVFYHHQIIFCPPDEDDFGLDEKLPQTMIGRVLRCSHALCAACFIQCGRACSEDDDDAQTHFHVRCPVCREDQDVDWESD